MAVSGWEAPLEKNRPHLTGAEDTAIIKMGRSTTRRRLVRITCEGRSLRDGAASVRSAASSVT